MDPIRQLEDLLESFNSVIEKCTEYRQDMYQPCAEQHVTKPFVRQEDEFSVHGIGFHYLLRRSLDVEILEANRARALECLELLYNFVETVESKLPGHRRSAALHRAISQLERREESAPLEHWLERATARHDLAPLRPQDRARGVLRSAQRSV